VARTQPDVDAPVTSTESQSCAASRLCSEVPKNADAKSLLSTGSPGSGRIRGSISVNGLPSASASKAGTFSMKAFATACSPSPYETVV